MTETNLKHKNMKSSRNITEENNVCSIKLKLLLVLNVYKSLDGKNCNELLVIQFCTSF